MPAEDPLAFARTVQARLSLLNFDAAPLVANARSTVEPDSAERRTAGGLDAALARLSHDPERLALGATLGEGGMAIVHLATQVALGRTVAAKRLRAEHLQAKQVEGLLHEAWVTGSLEHPNVVPVYDLSLDPEAGPVLVMKRIEGDTWSQLLASDDKLRERDEGDRLTFHLRVLSQVCNAVHFAHARGIIHRDLKPDNIMIGHFGEVLVADWGIATEPGYSKAFAGTPAYMAPEMLGEAALSVRTDVYLLGAVLFEILARRPPHSGQTIGALIASVTHSAPDLPPDAPAELAALVRACMAPAPEDRPDSALAVRQALDRFEQHRGSSTLTDRAEHLLADLEIALADTAPHAHLAAASLECRFAFREALRSWPDNRRAKQGLARTIQVLVAHELQAGDPKAARALLGELPEPDGELAARIANAENVAERDAEKIAALRDLGRQLDPRTGRHGRQLAGVILGAFWTAAPLLGGHFADGHSGRETLGAIVLSIASLILLLALARLTRLFEAQVSRQLWATVAFTMLVQTCALVAAWIAGIDQEMVVLSQLLLYCLLTGIQGIVFEPRFWVLSATYAVATALVGVWPASRHAIIAGSNFVLTLFVATIWSRLGAERAAARADLQAASLPRR